MKHSEIVAKLNEMVKEAGNQKDVAVKLGISPAYLSDVLHGRRAPGPRVLAALGMRRETVYRKGTETREQQ